jgi:hypothetical protein
LTWSAHIERQEAPHLDQPWRVIARGCDYLLSPQVPYEQVGYVPKSSLRAPLSSIARRTV